MSNGNPDGDTGSTKLWAACLLARACGQRVDGKDVIGATELLIRMARIINHRCSCGSQEYVIKNRKIICATCGADNTLEINKAIKEQKYGAEERESWNTYRKKTMTRKERYL